MAEERDEFIQLKWNTFQYCFLENLSTLRDKQVFTDVTLSCGDQFYPAHRLVLSSCSTFFARSLGVANCRSPVLLLHGIEQSTLEQLLMFMYDGQVTVSRQSLPSLLKAAHWLGVKGLESTFEGFENHERNLATGSQEPTSLPLQGVQMWKQLLSLAAENKGAGGVDPSSILHHIESNIDKNVMVSHVPSMNPSPELSDSAEDASTSEASDSRQNAQAVPLRPISENRLEVTCDSTDREKTFEGWGGSGRTDGNATKTAHGENKEEAENQGIAREKRSLRCKQCKKSFTVRTDLARHVRMFHGASKKFCSTCNIEFVNVKSQNLHMKLHDSKSIHGCNKCDFISHTKKNLEKHHLSHENENSVPGKKIVQEKDGQIVQQEVKAVLKVSPQNVPEMVTIDSSRKFCASCNLEFFSILAFNWHMKLHDSESLYKCSKCEFISISKKSLNKHILMHEGSKSAPEQKCQVVDQEKSVQEETMLLSEKKKFVQEEAVQLPSQEKFQQEIVQLQNQSQATTVVKCPTCSKVLRNDKVLKNHQQYCPGDKSKVNKSSVPFIRPRKRSVKRCSGGIAKGYRFSCSHCPFKGRKKMYVQVHMKKYHPGKN